ncbi:MAG: hypothetical protein V1853_02930 [bacterium]
MFGGINKNNSGLTLIETLVGLSLLIIVIGAALGLYYSGLQAIGVARVRVTAISIANEQMEIVRNLPYDDIGTLMGWPQGVLEDTRSITRNGQTFTITILPKYIDDPFDGNAFGSIPSKPLDTHPGDYKLIDIRVCWSHYPCNTPVSLSSNFVPPGVEGDDGTGSLHIRTIDAEGFPVGQADVHVTNSTTTPVIDIISFTDNDGNLILSSLPPALDTYHIEISKIGYSDDFTVTPDINNPNPTRPDTSVMASDVTSLAFFIDQTAELTLLTVDNTCTAIPNIELTLQGSWLDGTEPDVYRYNQAHTTDGSGQIILNDLRWDIYSQTVDPSEGYDVSGTTINQPYNILPASNQTVYVHLLPNQDNTLLISVRDSGTLTPLSDATVRVEDGVDYDETKSTGQGTLSQTDWSGGSGQIDYTDTTMFFSQDGNLDITQAGEIKLLQDLLNSSLSETFNTSIYQDFAETTADWNTANGEVKLVFDLDEYQSPSVVQSLRINPEQGEISEATLSAVENLNDQTIIYELSADGGVNFEPVTPGVAHNFIITGTDLRWRATLSTTLADTSPELLDILIDYDYSAYRASGVLTSSTMNVGANSAFDNALWSPISQPAQTGADSIKLQIATNTDQATWNFVGPDGTSGTYYTVSGDSLWAGHTNDQYIRYQISFSTADPSVTPSISEILLIHSAGCVPPGQTFFGPMDTDTYQITVNRNGYNEYIDSVDVNGDIVYDVELSPS